MSNTETEQRTRKRVIRPLVILLILGILYLAANYIYLRPSFLGDIAAWVYNALPLEQLFMSFSASILNPICGFILHVLYIWLILRILRNLMGERSKGEPIFKNKLRLFVFCEAWAILFHWFEVVCNPIYATTEWGWYASELTHVLLNVYTMDTDTLSLMGSICSVISAILTVFGFVMLIIWIFEKIISGIKAKRAAKKAKKQGKSATKPKASTTEKKDAPPKAEKKQTTQTQNKVKSRNGTSAMDVYAASAADEYLKRYRNSNVPVSPQPCIRMKLLSSSDAMDMEMIRPFQPDGSLFMSLDCGSFAYEMAFRLDDKGNAYLLGDQDVRLSPNAPFAACSKIDGKSVPQIFIEYIKG